MGHKVNAVGLRIGVNRDWEGQWFASKKDYANFLHEDIKIRKTLEASLKEAVVSHVDIKRTKTDNGHDVKVQVYVAKTGVALGQDGANITKVRNQLAKIVKSGKVSIDVLEVKDPDLDATLMAKWIASEIENRASYRVAQKKAIQRIRKAGAKGCRTLCSGRLGGAEIARAEGYKEGVVPLHTIRADIDFAHVFAQTAYGNIGIKVWICRSLNKEEVVAQEAADSKKGDMNNASTKAR